MIFIMAKVSDLAGIGTLSRPDSGVLTKIQSQDSEKA
jgi:hypothetical protein